MTDDDKGRQLAELAFVRRQVDRLAQAIEAGDEAMIVARWYAVYLMAEMACDLATMHVFAPRCTAAVPVWHCPHCNWVNNDMTSTKCEGCGKDSRAS